MIPFPQQYEEKIIDYLISKETHDNWPTLHENHARSAKIKLSYRYISFPIYYGITNKIYRNGLTIKIGYSPEFIYYDYIIEHYKLHLQQNFVHSFD